jgi:hypothetical protein
VVHLAGWTSFTMARFVCHVAYITGNISLLTVARRAAVDALAIRWFILRQPGLKALYQPSIPTFGLVAVAALAGAAPAAHSTTPLTTFPSVRTTRAAAPYSCRRAFAVQGSMDAVPYGSVNRFGGISNHRI